MKAKDNRPQSKIKIANLGKIISSAIALLSIMVFFSWLYSSSLQSPKPTSDITIKGGGLPPGCSCHSKNASLVTMHQLFSSDDCRKCHNKQDLTGKKSAKITPRRLEILRKRSRTKAICQQCHNNKNLLAAKKIRKTSITGRLFCPINQRMYSKKEAIKKNGKYFCPLHGDELIDIDKIVLESTKKPSNKSCIACHPIDKKLQAKHKTVVNNCLKCHSSHNKCGGCH